MNVRDVTVFYEANSYDIFASIASVLPTADDATHVPMKNGCVIWTGNEGTEWKGVSFAQQCQIKNISKTTERNIKVIKLAGSVVIKIDANQNIKIDFRQFFSPNDMGGDVSNRNQTRGNMCSQLQTAFSRYLTCLT